MKLPIIILSLLLSNPAEAAVYRNIPPSHGGYVALFNLEVNKSIRAGETPRITGRCDSACTLWLSHPRVCVTNTAVFGFHAASNAHGSRFLRQRYPARINNWINAHGGLTRKIIYLRGKELFKLVRRCS